jgi:FMN phosphatase YigB (HAD superfamily)
MFPNISHILYDLGNTLIFFDGDWDDVFRRAVAAAALAGRSFGLDAGRQAVLETSLADRLKADRDRRDKDLIEQPAGAVFIAALADAGFAAAGDDLLEALLAAYYAVTQVHWIAIPGVEQTLVVLGGRGYRQAVLSNAAHDADVQALVDKAGLRTHLDFVLSSAAIGRRKPDPRTFRRAAETWGVPPSSILMVGDTLAADIRGAEAAGMASVWVRKYSEGDPGGVLPDAVIETITDLPELLKK